MNIQRPLKQVSATELKVHSIFKTIQGEGPYCGRPAIFIRLWGCNLQCPNCDTEYTDKFQFFYTPEELVHTVNKLKGIQQISTIVVTGGEPFRQKSIYSFLSALARDGYDVQVETNGTYAILEPYMWLFVPNRIKVVCSPKTGTVHPTVAKIACCYKYVGAWNNLAVDGLPTKALGHPAKPILARPPKGMLVYLQPEDSKDDIVNKRNMDACVQSCMIFGYTLQLQIHKILGVE